LLAELSYREEQEMRIAANLSVLDEVELIEVCIQHLRAIGVDLIVVTDLGSIDGTRERLASFAEDPDISLILLRRNDDPWGFPARTYEKTIAEFAVDRVLFLDADEFWLPKSGNLKTTATLAAADALSVRRLNIPLVAGRPVLPTDLSPGGYNDLYLVASGRTNADRALERERDLVWIMTEGAPKTIVNPATVNGVGMGHHQVIKKQGTQPNVVRPNDLIIAHAPFSTSARFLRKLENIDRSLTTFGHRLVGPEAWHWRRWLQIAREGKVDEEFRRQALTEEQFQARLRDATIQSAATVLEAMAGAD
jgi:hypothetical protein